MSKWQIYILCCATIFLGAFFRFYAITEIPLGLYPDEAMNGNNALEAFSTGSFKIFYPENNGREGLFINLQALSLAVFGNEAWALRVVSALFGTLTILGIYLLTKELLLKSDFNSRSVALLASFFLATSFWHINFSRIGFRAILVPFFATFGLYFLLKGLRRMSIFNIVWASIFIGLGFHTYIAFRFMPFVLAIPIGWYLWNWWKEHKTPSQEVLTPHPVRRIFFHKVSCSPCLIALFLLITFVVAIPIGLYFLRHPDDFFGRATDVSVFSAESPVKEFFKSNVLTLGMFFVHGDCNWRHNFNCQPALHPLVMIFFIIGIAVLTRSFYRNPTSCKLQATSLTAWLFFMSLPATLTREGMPHALRSIGMILPVMILAGLGAYKSIELIAYWVEKQKDKWQENTHQLDRIKKELIFLFLLLLLVIPLKTFRTYFILWAHNPDTYFSFSTDTLHLGQFLDTLPDETKKYVIVNRDGVHVRGIPMPAQTVMFATDTFREESRTQKNIAYVLPADIETLSPPENKKAVIALLDGADRSIIRALREKFPDYKIHAPSDFTILESRKGERSKAGLEEKNK